MYIYIYIKRFLNSVSALVKFLTRTLYTTLFSYVELPEDNAYSQISGPFCEKFDLVIK